MSQFKAAKGFDVRERCAKFDMNAVNEADEVFLAALYRTLLIRGGEITIHENGSDTPQIFKVPGMLRR